MTLKGASSQACAACKYQRRRCLPDCQLAPYFPADQPKMFQNAHRLFGVSNILKILKLVDPSQRSEAMRSIIYESDMRHKHPVLGCYGLVHQLAYQVTVLEEQLHALRLQIEFRKMQQQQNKHQNSSDHLVLQDNGESSSLLQLGMAPPNPVNINNDLTDGFSCCNNDEQYWGIQQGAQFGVPLVLNNDNNLMDRFEMTGDHQQQQHLFDVHLQQQQQQQQQEMVRHFEGMHPFVDCGGQSSFIGSKVAFESSSSGSDDQSPSLRNRMDAMRHQVAESSGLKNEGTCFGVDS